MSSIGKFEADYARESAIYDLYKKAETEEERAEAGAKMDAFKAELKAEGLEYVKIYYRYVQARNRGNRHINFDDLRSTPAETVATLRKFGIEVFTFSSRWSGMIDDIAEFLKAGCQFCGMAEIYSSTKKFMSDEYETENAIVFCIP